jgi:hypothetical protein
VVPILKQTLKPGLDLLCNYDYDSAVLASQQH